MIERIIKMLNKWHFTYDVIDRSVALQIYCGDLRDSEDPIISYFDALSYSETNEIYQMFTAAYHLYLIDVNNL